MVRTIPLLNYRGFSQITKQHLPSAFVIGPVDTVFFKVTVEDLQHKLSESLN